MIKRLIWTIWTPMSSVLKKADKLNLSLSFHHVGGSINLFMASTGDVWIIPFHLFEFGVMCCMVSVFHVSSRIVTDISVSSQILANISGSSLLLLVLQALLEKNITINLLSLSLDFFKILLFQVAFLLFFPIAIFSPILSSGWFVLAVCGFISVRELVNSLRPSDAYMRQQTNHHWFR